MTLVTMNATTQKYGICAQVTYVFMRNCQVGIPENAARQNEEFLQVTADCLKAMRGFSRSRLRGMFVEQCGRSSSKMNGNVAQLTARRS